MDILSSIHLRPSPNQDKLLNHISIKEARNLGGIHTVIYRPLIPEPLNGFQTVFIDPGVWCTSEHYMVKYLAEMLLSQGCAVVSLDHTGLADPSIDGQTPGESNKYRINTLMQDVETVVRGLSAVPYIDRSNLVGCGISLGGVILADTEIVLKENKQSPLFSKLLLLSPSYLLSTSGKYFLDKLKPEGDRWFYLTSSGRKKYVNPSIFSDTDLQAHPGVSLDICKRLNPPPVTLVFGELDDQQSGPKLHRTFDQAGINSHLVPNAGHNLNDNEQVKDALKEILKKEVI